MALFQGLIQPPKIQSAEETIPTLCDRVENATLISDRRSAVLGLKAFSRDYREAVIASGLKPLISTLKKDSIDEDSVKAILETLLILFIRGEGDADLTRNWISQQSRLQNGKYPSPLIMKQERQSVDQFSLWIADFMTQNDELVQLFIKLLETENFHIRLYTTQLLEAFVASRPSRTRDAILSIPVGISALVSLLDDIHEPVRDEAILLLMVVANNSPHIQKLVAFENIFQRLFAIIKEEGGLRGSLVVSDCLSLIVNLLSYSTSNQTLFLETGNLPQMASLLNEPMEEEFFWNDQRLLNIKTTLEILRLTVEPHSTTTPRNQKALSDSHLLMIVLRLALSRSTPNSVRPYALSTAADMIRENEKVQSEFRKIDAPLFDPSLGTNQTQEEQDLVPIVDLLLNWCFFANSIHTFDIRYASSELIKAYLANNHILRMSFINSQASLFEESNDILNGSENILSKPCIFNILLDYDPELKLNPYKLFFAVDLLMFLFDQDHAEELREVVRNVKCPDLSTEEDPQEMTSPIQTICELTLTSFSLEDPRVSISYLCLLIFWIFGDSGAVDDFLSHRVTLKSLISSSAHIQRDDSTINCLICMLLGVAYEFSTPKSSLSRSEYFALLNKSIGADNYSFRIKQFTENSLFTSSREMKGVLDSVETDVTGLPKIYFSSYFKKLLRNNLYRIQTAMKRGPDFQIKDKVSFESLEKLIQQKTQLEEALLKSEESSKGQIEDLNRSLEELQKALKSTEDERKAAELDLENVRASFKNLEDNYSGTKEELNLLQKENSELVATNSKIENTKKDLELKFNNNRDALTKLEKELSIVCEQKKAAEDGINKMNRELLVLSREHNELKNTSTKSKNELEKVLAASNEELKRLQDFTREKDSSIEKSRAELERLKSENKALLLEKDNASRNSAELKSRLANQESLVSKLTTKLKDIAEKYKSIEQAKASKEHELAEVSESNQTKILSLQSEIVELRQQYDSMKHDKDNMLTETKKLKKSLEDAERSRSEAAYEIKQLKSELDHSSKEIEQLNSSSEEKSKNLADAVNTFNKARNELESLNKTLAEANDKLRSRESTIGSLEEKLQELKKSSDEKIASLEKSRKDLEKFQQKFRDLELEKSKTQDALTDLQKALQDEKNNHQESLQLQKDKIKQLALEKENSAESTEALKSEVSKLRQTVEDLNKSHKLVLEDYEKKVSELKKKTVSLQDESSLHLQEVSALNTELEETRSRAEKLEEQATDLKEKHKNICNEIKSKVKQEKEKDSRILVLDKEMKSAKTDLSDIVHKLEASNSEIAKLQEIKAEFESQELEGKKQKEDFDAEIKTLRAKLKEKSAEVEKERKMLNEGSSNLEQEYSRKISQLEEELESLESKHSLKHQESDNEKRKLSGLLKKSESSATEKNRELECVRESMKKLRESLKDKEQQSEQLSSLQKTQSDKMREELELANQKLEEAREKGRKHKENLEVALSQKASEVKKLKDQALNYLSKLDEKEAIINESKVQLETAKRDSDELKSSMDSKIKKSQETLSKAENERDQLRLELDLSKEKLEVNNQRLHELDATEAQLKDLKMTIENNLHLLSNSEAAKRNYEALSKSLAQECEKVSSTLKEVASQKDEVESKLRTSENALSTHAKKIAETELQQNTEVKRLEDEIAKLKKQAEDRSEVDDLMLLVTELDEKNQKYRNKLKALGADFSSDEEDEEEDEEDED
ncbi:Uso1p [Lachancea thermotolerans]